MTGIPSADDVPDADIDATLRVYGYDPDEPHPEHSHNTLRNAWREGYETALAAVRDAVGAAATTTCAWCDEPATGQARQGDGEPPTPSCGAQHHGFDYPIVRIP